jgi:hypothetical protein
MRISIVGGNSALIALVASALLSVTGCGTVEVVDHQVTQGTLPPDVLLQDCLITPPPPQADYLLREKTVQETASERERKLTAFANAQTKNIIYCNLDKKALREWKAKIKSGIEEKPKGK